MGIKDLLSNNAWPSKGAKDDPDNTTDLALPNIGSLTYREGRRYVRCYELLEHGFYSESFIVAFSILDDFVQEMLHRLLGAKGLDQKERDQLIRGLKENRLKMFLGPLLKLAFGQDIHVHWPDAEAAIHWLNSVRNKIAHAAETADHATAAKGIYVCLKILVVLRDAGIAPVDIHVELFRYAKITAAWTDNAPSWIPSGEVSESMDFRT